MKTLADLYKHAVHTAIELEGSKSLHEAETAALNAFNGADINPADWSTWKSYFAEASHRIKSLATAASPSEEASANAQRIESSKTGRTK